MGLLAIAHFKKRAGLVMTSNYIEIWLKSIGWVLGIKTGEFCIIRGADSLKKIVALSKAGENNYKLIFFSISTLRNFLKDHLTTGYTIDGVGPRELFETLGIGVRIVDEAHENPHALAMQNIFTHVPLTIYLSATLSSDDPFINKQYDKMFPYDDRYKHGTNNTHAEAYCVYYNLERPEKAQYMGSKGYSHITYEQWMMRNSIVLGGYFELLKMLLDENYVRCRKEGQKALVFCSTTEFCDRFARWLKKEYEGQDITVSDYVGYHDPNVLYSNDIVITTPLSAGTGKDIPGLLTCISSVAIGSQQKNLQMLGRLRELKDYPEDSPRYLYLTCSDIPKHQEYHKRKVDYFKNRTKSIQDYYTHHIV
jgi:superfamily II DNA or RNA helicase